MALPAGSVTTPWIEVRDLDVTLPRTGLVLRGISCAIARGELVAIVGPSGCGKSTLLRAVAGLTAPSRGTVGFPAGPPAIGMVFQQPALLPWRSVEGNVRLPLELAPRRTAIAVGDWPPAHRTAGRVADPAAARTADRLADEPADRVRDLLRLVGLDGFAAASPHELSGGMRMRAALARALVTGPSLLLLDEPFAALDYLTREELQVHVHDLHARAGLTTLLVTHDVTEAAFLADRVLILSDRPGMVRAEVAVPLGPDRGAALRRTADFHAVVDAIRVALEPAVR